MRWLAALGLLFVATGASQRKCKTACDCKPGYDCANGECLCGTIAVYCCNTCPPFAPPEQVCDHPDGRRGECRKPPVLHASIATSRAPRECGAGPCCGDPPEPCGEWLAKQDGGRTKSP